ncbi:Annexin [Ascodesmis nigricans]|uniref:Annexin n=1 Tax=Ascodesmis nigricans TaxID=341454 RepID=A0A4S2MLM0_9PEZI|nr:Annexin [Ascodesmis nigricans]
MPINKLFRSLSKSSSRSINTDDSGGGLSRSGTTASRASMNEAPTSPAALYPPGGAPPPSHTPPPQPYPYPYPAYPYYPQHGYPPQSYPGTYYPPPQGYPHPGYPPYPPPQGQQYPPPASGGDPTSPTSPTAEPVPGVMKVPTLQLPVPPGGVPGGAVAPSSSGDAVAMSPSLSIGGESTGDFTSLPTTLDQPPPYAELPGGGSSDPPTGFPTNENIPPAVPLVYSPGYNNDVSTNYKDAMTDASIIQKSLTAKELDLTPILAILVNRTPEEILALKEHFTLPIPRLVDTALSSSIIDTANLRLGLLALLLGPLDFDVFLLHQCLTNREVFKNPWQLQLILLDRLPGDIHAIKTLYAKEFGISALGSDLRDAMKSAAKQSDPIVHLYQNVLDCTQRPGLTEVDDEFTEVVEQGIFQDVSKLRVALAGNSEGNVFAHIFTTSSPERLQVVLTRFIKEQKLGTERQLFKTLKSKFSSPFAEALIYIAKGAMDNGDGHMRASRDADLLEKTMKGMGTRDQELLARLMRVQWDKVELRKVKECYRMTVKSSGLVSRIKSETSRKWMELLVAVAKSDDVLGEIPVRELFDDPIE